MQKSQVAISVIVPTYNRREIVRRSLETLFAQDFPNAQFEIIVVVDGSTDGTAEDLRALGPRCLFRVIEQENRGLAGARNTGFRAAESDLVLFLDDDMRCDRGLVSAHVKAHQRPGSAVVFGALFLAPDSRKNLAAECFLRELGAFHLKHLEDPGLPWQLSECVFSNSSLPRRMLVEAGGFDESFRAREDLELGIRLMERGAVMVYVSDAVAHQFYDKTAVDLLADAERFGVADAMLARKHPNQIVAGHLKWMECQTDWKAKLREIGMRWPWLERCFLAPFCFLGEMLFAFPPVRVLGVRALQIRRRIHWLRGARGFTGS